MVGHAVPGIAVCCMHAAVEVASNKTMVLDVLPACSLRFMLLVSVRTFLVEWLALQCRHLIINY